VSKLHKSGPTGKFIKLTVFLLVFSLFVSANFYSFNNILHAQSLEDELEQVKKDREETQKKIEDAKKQEQTAMKDVKDVETVLLSSLSQLDGLNDKMSEAKSEIDQTTVELVLKEDELRKIEAELNQKVEIMNSRISAMYKTGGSNFLEILLKAENFLELVSRLKLMNILAQQDAKILNEIKDERSANLTIKKGILDLREKQKQKKEEIASLVQQAEKKQREVQSLYDEKSSLLAKKTANKNALVAMEKDLEIKEAQITRILESYKYGSAPGKFMWPVGGRVASGFGYRIHPIFGYRRFHSGIDIVAPSGTIVKAANGGEVVSAGYDGGYGYSIVIYHGGGFATWYAHLSRILVTPGQKVGMGQVIGLVGSTGWATGPHLHFEVRINGAAQNPMQYLQ
jgi:murein DD-endopeptidase MepM/ murein hydrolase activator NlpD